MINRKKERILDVNILLKDDNEGTNVEVRDVVVTDSFVVLIFLDGSRLYLNNDRISAINVKEK